MQTYCSGYSICTAIRRWLTEGKIGVPVERGVKWHTGAARSWPNCHLTEDGGPSKNDKLLTRTYYEYYQTICRNTTQVINPDNSSRHNYCKYEIKMFLCGTNPIFVFIYFHYLYDLQRFPIIKNPCVHSLTEVADKALGRCTDRMCAEICDNTQWRQLLEGARHRSANYRVPLQVENQGCICASSAFTAPPIRTHVSSWRRGVRFKLWPIHLPVLTAKEAWWATESVRKMSSKAIYPLPILRMEAQYGPVASLTTTLTELSEVPLNYIQN